MPRGKPLDLTGKTYGKWKVLARLGVDRSRNVLWHCRCTCGNESVVRAGSLVNGLSTQCVTCRRKNSATRK